MPVVLIAARWIHFAATFGLLGSSFVWAFIAGDATHPAPLAMQAIRWVVLAIVASGSIVILAMLASMSGSVSDAADPEFLEVFFLETPFGPVVSARLALLAALATAACIPMSRERRLTWMIILSATLLASQAWLGHAAEGGATLDGAAMIAAYAIHVLAGAVWIGGLPVLLVSLVDGGGAFDRLGLLRRFAAVASVAVAAILLTGIVNAGFRVGWQAAAFIGTRYGAVLLCKLVLVATMLCVAATNRFYLVPRLAETLVQQETVRRWLKWSVASEIALGALVLGAAAVLGVTPPPQ